MSIRELYDAQCDACGKPANLPKVSNWQALQAAHDKGWATMYDGTDLCPDCSEARRSKGGSPR